MDEYEYSDLINAVSDTVHQNGLSATEKANAVLAAFDAAASLDDLGEFLAWFGEGEDGEVIVI